MSVTCTYMIGYSLHSSETIFHSPKVSVQAILNRKSSTIGTATDGVIDYQKGKFKGFARQTVDTDKIKQVM